MIRLKRSNNTFFYTKTFKYWILYNHASGRKDRYDVFILNADDPVTVGRELDLAAVRSLIEDYEEVGSKLDYYGDRESVLEALQIVSKRRLHTLQDGYFTTQIVPCKEGNTMTRKGAAIIIDSIDVRLFEIDETIDRLQKEAHALRMRRKELSKVTDAIVTNKIISIG